MISVLEAHAKAHIEKHVMNVEVFLENPVGVGEHSSVMEAIEHELDMISKYDSQLEVLVNYFSSEIKDCDCDEMNEVCECNS